MPGRRLQAPHHRRVQHPCATCEEALVDREHPRSLLEERHLTHVERVGRTGPRAPDGGHEQRVNVA